MKMIHTELPPEAELAIELRCREVMACEDTDRLKAFCIDMMKNHARAETVLSKANDEGNRTRSNISCNESTNKKNYRNIQSQMVDRATLYALEV